ncbi:LacI family DNA-binding transcriptional regulator [Leifsonia sp. NPDC058292]|uniref:LacI family DNA-binding transcriptional regulator n=1 Tax=Leifsonia sp. NPDC058292 TaxID=3346428 RepID=UPI0036D88D2D
MESSEPPAADRTPRRRATIRDVALAAGVSTSAVSKVLRSAPGVSPQMRGRVERAIEELNYRPHAGARGMRGTSFTIGVMLTEFSSPFQPEVVDGISAQLEATPYQEIAIRGGAEPWGQRRSIEALFDRQVDGVIVIAPWTSQAWLEDLGRDIPTVVVARHGAPRTFDTVVDDDALGAQLIVDHLTRLGHSRIAHTTQPSGGLRGQYVLSHTERLRGYEAAMRERGLTPDVVETAYTERGGYDAGIALLERDNRPTAIFAGADVAALGAVRAAEERGLHVPGDISIAGYDDITVSGMSRVGLTTVNQSAHETGMASARLLLERIGGRRDPVRHVVTPRLAVRSTTAAPPT